MAQEGAFATDLNQPLTEEQVDAFIEIFEEYMGHVGMVMWRKVENTNYHGATKTYYEDGVAIVHHIALKTLDFFVLKHELAHCIVAFEEPRCRYPHGLAFDDAVDRVERIFHHFRDWPERRP